MCQNLLTKFYTSFIIGRMLLITIRLLKIKIYTDGYPVCWLLRISVPKLGRNQSCRKP